jgi:hypothetical protein
MKVTYTSNNSGGNWWLTDKNWKDLEKAGWKVEWIKDSPFHKDYSEVKKTGRWLGCLAKEASREGLHLREAVDEWENITGQCATDAGCPCCGQPHYFIEEDDKGKWVDDGPSIHYEASW